MTRPELQRIYEESGLSKRAFADAIGVSDTAVRGWLKGENISGENEKRIRGFRTKTPASPPPGDERGVSSAPAPPMPRESEPPPPSEPGVIRPWERVTAVGMTGSGKTLLATIIANMESAPTVFVDTSVEGSVSEQDLPGFTTVGVYDPALDNQIVRLNPDDRKAVDTLCGTLLRRGNMRVIFDELANLPKTSSPLKRLFREGRKRWIGIIALTQEPRDIPTATLAEYDHLFVFALQHRDYRAFIRQQCRIPDTQIPTTPLIARYLHHAAKNAPLIGLYRGEEQPIRSVQETAEARRVQPPAVTAPRRPQPAPVPARSVAPEALAAPPLTAIERVDSANRARDDARWEKTLRAAPPPGLLRDIVQSATVIGNAFAQGRTIAAHLSMHPDVDPLALRTAIAWVFDDDPSGVSAWARQAKGAAIIMPPVSIGTTLQRGMRHRGLIIAGLCEGLADTDEGITSLASQCGIPLAIFPYIVWMLCRDDPTILALASAA